MRRSQSLTTAAAASLRIESSFESYCGQPAGTMWRTRARRYAVYPPTARWSSRLLSYPSAASANSQAKLWPTYTRNGLLNCTFAANPQR